MKKILVLFLLLGASFDCSAMLRHINWNDLVNRLLKEHNTAARTSMIDVGPPGRVNYVFYQVLYDFIQQQEESIRINLQDVLEYLENRIIPSGMWKAKRGNSYRTSQKKE